MVKYTRLTAASLAIAALTLAACSKGDSAKQDSLKQDSTLAANLALASADSAAKVKPADTALVAKSPAKPRPRERERAKPAAVAPAPAPVPERRREPAPAPAPAAPTMGTIAAGTTITLAASSNICTNTNAVGDNVTATAAGATSGSNGVAIPAGATFNLTVTALKRSENAKDPIVMTFNVISVAFNGKTYPVTASVASADVTKIRDEPKAKDVEKVAAGAIIGGIAGKLIGKSTKGAVIGAAAGGAAGAGVAVATANYQGCINQGHNIIVRLDGPLNLTVGAF